MAKHDKQRSVPNADQPPHDIQETADKERDPSRFPDQLDPAALAFVGVLEEAGKSMLVDSAALVAAEDVNVQRIDRRLAQIKTRLKEIEDAEKEAREGFIKDLQRRLMEGDFPSAVDDDDHSFGPSAEDVAHDQAQREELIALKREQEEYEVIRDGYVRAYRNAMLDALKESNKGD